MTAQEPTRLLAMSRHVAGMANSGWITEQHAVEFLADAAARDPALLRDAALHAQDDPDAVPLVAALLDRAVTAAQTPFPTPRPLHSAPILGGLPLDRPPGPT